MDFIFVVFFDIWPILAGIAALIVVGLFLSVDVTTFGANWLQAHSETISYIGTALFFIIALILAIKIGIEFKKEHSKCGIANTIMRIIAYAPISMLGGYVSFGTTVKIMSDMLGDMDNVLSFILLIFPMFLCFILLIIFMAIIVILFVVLPIHIMYAFEDFLQEKAKTKLQSIFYSLIANLIPLLALTGIIFLLLKLFG